MVCCFLRNKYACLNVGILDHTALSDTAKNILSKNAVTKLAASLFTFLDNPGTDNGKSSLLVA